MSSHAIRALSRAFRRTTAPRGSADDVVRRLGGSLLDSTRLDPSAPAEHLELVELGSLAEYEAHVRDAATTLRNRAAVERLLAAGQAPFVCHGYDACVDRFVDYEVDFQYAWQRSDDGLMIPNYRERLVSPATQLNCRQRATALVLRRLLDGRDPSSVALYATEAVTPVFAFLKARHPRLVGSEYLGPDVPPGEIRNGVRHEDVTRLSFGDAVLDAIVSCDVLEHVPSFATAMREFRRVLAPGGFLLATAPFRADRDEHLVRARVSESGEVVHLEPPEYHGDPVDPAAGILCYQHFGWRIIDDLRAAGFRRARAFLVWSYFHGIMGGNQVLFHAEA